MTSDPITLFDRLAQARERLVAAGIRPADAGLDVGLFARTILGWDQARLLTDRQLPQPAGLEPRFSEWVARRERHEPVAYILGEREFWGLTFVVSPAVLIPRHETEMIVEEALLLLQTLPAPRVADIGTGSGNIAVALAHAQPRARIVASDISGDALAVARENAVRNGVADRIEFVQTSHLDGIDGAFDLIAANPPYVKSGDKPALARDVQHEPEIALFGGGAGLHHIELVLDAALARLRPGGWLLMEFGFGQDDAVSELVAARAGLRLDRIRADLQGIPRTAIMRRAA